MLITASLITVASSGIANAKTEGTYLGLDILATKQKLDNDSEISPGIGINASHAINFDGLYLAPALFFNYNNSEVEVSLGSGITYGESIDYSYGAKVNLGYDVNDKVSLFTLLGFQVNEIKSEIPLFNYKVSATENSILYGIGAKYSLQENLDLVASYNYSDYIDSSIDSDVNNSIVSVGLAYKF